MGEKINDKIKLKRNILILIWISLVIGMFVLINAETAEQKVTATVVPGILNIESPSEGAVYQDNEIPFIIKVTTGSNNVKNIFLIEGKQTKNLCSKCNEFNKKLYLPDGEHEIKIKVEFMNKDVIEKDISFIVDTNSDIYIISGNVLKKATIKNILNYLFNYNFSLSYKRNTAPDDSCSVRAEDGNALINNEEFGDSNNKINFYSVLSTGQGQGNFFIQKERRRNSFDFKVVDTIENSDEKLVIEVEKRNKEKIIIDFDKINKVISLAGNNFSVENMKVYFTEGCSSRRQSFYLLEKEEKISRDIEEVRQILIDNPIFLKRYASLNFLFSKFWRIRQILGYY